MSPDLLLCIVAYHPTKVEVDRLKICLSFLPSNIKYAVYVNDYQQNEPVDGLAADSFLFLRNSANIGYGRAINQLVENLVEKPTYLGFLNTDLAWNPGTFETILHYACSHDNVNLIVPKIINTAGKMQMLCKRNPTVLAIFSRRFVPSCLKPSWLANYDAWYVMADQDYQSIFPVPYLSGCCMVSRASVFLSVGGFDERFFLYLEDADLTRAMSQHGLCIHFPNSTIMHDWGRGSYTNFKLMIINLMSAWKYFCKWGLQLW